MMLSLSGNKHRLGKRFVDNLHAVYSSLLELQIARNIHSSSQSHTLYILDLLCRHRKARIKLEEQHHMLQLARLQLNFTNL